MLLNSAVGWRLGLNPIVRRFSMRTQDIAMPNDEEPIRVFCALIDAMNSGDHPAGLASMTEDVSIIDDVPPFRRNGRKEAERWFERLSVARERVEASLTLENAEIRVAGGRAYVVAPGLYREPWTERVWM